MSDFYAIYMVGKLGPRATTSVLNIFPKSDPKQSQFSSFSGKTWQFRELPNLITCFNNNNCLMTKNLEHIYIATLFIFLFHQTNSQIRLPPCPSRFFPFLHQNHHFLANFEEHNFIPSLDFTW